MGVASQAGTIALKIRGFAKDVREQFPPGGPIRFRYRFGEFIRIGEGVVSRHQVPDGELADTGLNVVISHALLAETGRDDERPGGSRDPEGPVIRVNWTAIVE